MAKLFGDSNNQIDDEHNIFALIIDEIYTYMLNNERINKQMECLQNYSSIQIATLHMKNG